MAGHVMQGVWMVGLPMLVLGLLLLRIYMLVGNMKSSRTRRSVRAYLLVGFVFLLPVFGFVWLLRWHLDDVLAHGELEGELLRHTEMARAICTVVVLVAVTAGIVTGIAVVSALRSKVIPLYESLEEAMASGRRLHVAVMGPTKDTATIRLFLWPTPDRIRGALAVDLPAEQVPADLRAPTTEFVGVFDQRGALVSVERGSSV